MSIIGMLVGGLAGKGIEAGANFAKQKLDESKAAKQALEDERLREIYTGAAFRLPKGFCEGANGKVWRVIDVQGNQFCLLRKGSKEYVEWFDYNEIKDYYEDV